MALMLSIGGVLKPATESHPATDGYSAIEIGKPLSVEVLTFHPGGAVGERRAEILLSSRVRTGPSAQPGPRRVNALVTQYNGDTHLPILALGGGHFGDQMLYYTKSYVGGRVAMSLYGHEVDHIPTALLEGTAGLLNTLGKVALFTGVAPYLKAAGAGVRIFSALATRLNKGKELIRNDLGFHNAAIDQLSFQPGRFLLFKDGGDPSFVMQNFRLTGPSEPIANIVVHKTTNAPMKRPYWVLKVNGQDVPGYDDYGIGSGTADILEKFPIDPDHGGVLEYVTELAQKVADAENLASIGDLADALAAMEPGPEADQAQTQISAYKRLLSEKAQRALS